MSVVDKMAAQLVRGAKMEMHGGGESTEYNEMLRSRAME